MTSKALRVKIVDRSRQENGVDGCWLWDGCVTGNGYGAIRVEGAQIGAHRASYLAFKGEIPAGMCVCHRCDVPTCVNPAHLFLGTVQDNQADKTRKGRQARGRKNGRAKLSAEKVREIFAAHLLGESKKSIARRYEVSDTLVRLVLRREIWTHVNPDSQE